VAVVWVPPLLRNLTDGRETVAVAGANIREVIESLDAAYPGAKARLCTEYGLRTGIAVAVDSQLATLGLDQPVVETSEVHFLPAISGGSSVADEVGTFHLVRMFRRN
jgi:molybdopterin synthase sulfur carrier subunit